MLSLRLACSCILFIMIACNPDMNSSKHQDISSVAEKQKDTVLNKSIRVGKIDSLFERKQLVFKNWLIDTLKILDTSVASFNKNAKFVKKEVVLNSDSLGLSVNSLFNVSLYEEANIGTGDVQKLLSLLREFNEYPQGQFALKFKADYFFAPSPVPELPYDMTFDIEDVQVIEREGKKISRYDIVRGRIGAKHVTTLLADGRKTEENINFLWKGGKLIKEKSN